MKTRSIVESRYIEITQGKHKVHIYRHFEKVMGIKSGSTGIEIRSQQLIRCTEVSGGVHSSRHFSRFPVLLFMLLQDSQDDHDTV